MSRPVPIALTIAGSDSSGGAGIQADLKTFSAFGVYGASVLTALTAQNTRGVAAVHAVPAGFVAAQIVAVMSDLAVDAIKTGMLCDAAIADTVAAAIAARPAVPVVVDPVMIATSGHALLEPDAVAVVRDRLMPLATLITPNLPEAARLLECPMAADGQEMAEQGRALLAMGARAVLIKGGHGSGEAALDLLVTDAGVRPYEMARLDTTNTHGTGCTLSAAIAALLAGGVALDEAVGRAKSYVWQALEAGRELAIGAGHGPVDHLYAVRRQSPPA